MKVKANDKFKNYRNASLKLDKKDYRKLQQGKTIELSKSKIEEYPHIYEEVKRNGN